MTISLREKNDNRLQVVLFGATVFVSAFLLFQVQPLIARYILPWFGGSASVWSTFLLFFQVALLVGYGICPFDRDPFAATDPGNTPRCAG